MISYGKSRTFSLRICDNRKKNIMKGTSKEAKKIINQFANAYGVKSHPERDMIALSCAIIHVNRLIKVTHSDPYPRPKTHMDKEFWKEVAVKIIYDRSLEK